MSSKAQKRSNDKTHSEQSSPRAITESANVAQQQIHPATLTQPARLDSRSLKPSDVLQLQRTIGNQAAGNLLAEKLQRQDSLNNKNGLPGNLKSGAENFPNSPKAAELQALAPTHSVIQLQKLPHGRYRITKDANLRNNDHNYSIIRKLLAGEVVCIIDKGGRESNFKAGLITNEHSWIQTNHGETGWVEDSKIDFVSASVSDTSKSEEEDNEPKKVQESDEVRFTRQVRILEHLASYLSQVKQARSLQVSKYAEEANASAKLSREELQAYISTVDPDRELQDDIAIGSSSLVERIKHDKLVSGGMMILDESVANLEPTDWVKKIRDEDLLYDQFKKYFKKPAPRPEKKRATGALGLLRGDDYY
jgi:hypothetical protein